MAEHSIFYYPYASFTNAQLPLLKVAAQYFDKMYLLDPVGASWDTIGADPNVREALKLLQQANILQTITPSEVLARYEQPIEEAILADLHDQEFTNLCSQQERQQGKDRWTLALAKVPHNLPQKIQEDKALRHLVGDFARRAAQEAGNYLEHVQASTYQEVSKEVREYYNYAETGRVFDEYREGYGGPVEYRYADFPLALGEAIMMNHALFTGLLHAGATPITDDLFHNQVLSRKLRRAAQDPAVHQALMERIETGQISRDLLASAALALPDTRLELPVLNYKLPLVEVLEYRRDHEAELQQARDALGQMACDIKAEPWSEAFFSELKYTTIPAVKRKLDEVRKVHRDYVRRRRRRLALGAAGVAGGAATAVLTLFGAPLTTAAFLTFVLGLTTSAAIPGAQLWLDSHDGQTKPWQEYDLHYLLRYE